jgi:hypothetical protein
MWEAGWGSFACFTFFACCVSQYRYIFYMLQQHTNTQHFCRLFLLHLLTALHDTGHRHAACTALSAVTTCVVCAAVLELTAVQHMYSVACKPQSQLTFNVSPVLDLFQETPLLNSFQWISVLCPLQNR